PPPAGAAPGAVAPVLNASAAPVTREGLVGAWKVSSGGGNCQIFMALTKWTGGYRAASRGCPGQVADVSAWDVAGSQVVLKDSGGSTVASLSNSGGTRYDGQTTGGQAISLYR
ncbi:MAG: protease inhibitor Inh/omp19 family protein, partial [Rhizobiaceae bacterium]|nr:protease inhibitor Inh/omp19 family protein [Rhizobiaceae bacterium]